ncbi:hypothetical protein CA267_012465 [Alteromonas pelagimontana]|uniref:Sulfotransferase family protein n=1 Tax=Alteromonas pelagimontana TaxID=1858656 RepID=A0A6M4MFZ6_9ALTE|nr:hypothetical protein [Alteromonas pelagimontana]QJR81535.1 hypothetical protein CA267_012465 [Alteromonas pelagimontana]
MKIIFHFGPPKTGTSAIQKWCSLNHEWLKNQGVYYPQHAVDVNGVSSGNLRKVFEGEKGSFHFSKALYESEVARARKADCHTLLFSSEFFFKNIEMIADTVPEATFIGYIRFGLEILQSSYNQAVKRHGKTTKFSPNSGSNSTLNTLSIKIQAVGESRFILRPYSTAIFKNNSLIADFLEALHIDNAHVNTTVGNVNSSYSLESIEVKRWFNQLESEALQVQLDLALQSYGKREKISLFSDDKFEAFKSMYLNQLKRFLNAHTVAKSEEFYAECRTLQNLPSREQELSLSQFEKILRTLVRQKKISLLTLYKTYQIALERKEQLEQPERVAVLKKILPIWVVIVEKLRRRCFSSNEV